MASSIMHMALDASKLVARQSGSTAAGTARHLQQSSASKVLNTLWPVALYSIGFFILFVFLRRFYPRVYMPRTFVSSLDAPQRSPDLPKGLFNWCLAFYNTPNIHVLNTQGTLDGYLFLRLLRVSIVSCVVGCCIIFPILIPINVTGAANLTQLNILTFSNVAIPSDQDSYYRFYAHVVCAYLFFGYILYMITRESLFYINLRQAYLISPTYANRISSRTVLFLSIPAEYLKEDVLRNLLGPELVRNVWIPQNADELVEKVQERDNMLMKLEGSEIDLIKKANIERIKSLKAGTPNLSQERINVDDDRSGSVAARWITPKDRSTHKIGFWGLWGAKVDTIDWCRKELGAKIEEVKHLQSQHRAFKGKSQHSAFVEFHTLRDAQSAYQLLTHHMPLHMAPRYTGMYPDEIIWGNLRILWWERIIRVTACYALVVAVIALWSFPIAFVGAVSNVKYLETLPGLQWLSFIDKLGFLTGVVTGLIPVVLLSILMAILPIFLRLMARLGGDPTNSAVEYTVQSTYFWFYIIQGFLVTTLSSSVTQAAATIFNNPASVVNLLAKSLPESSNFYLSYFVLQGLGVVSQVLISLGDLFVFLVLGRILDKTPRKLYARWTQLSSPSLGSYYPVYTTLFVIAIAYSCIAPLVIGFAAIGLTLFYLAFKYEFLYVYNVAYDTKGLMYARALQQLFVGVYLAEGCMIGLFAINLGASRRVLGPLVLMIILLVFTALYHFSLNTALQPTLQYLPKTLEIEERRLLEEEDAFFDVEDGAPSRAGARDGSEGRSVELGSSRTSTGTEKEGEKHGEKEAEKKLPPTPKEKEHQKQSGNIFQKWLRPDKYADYHTLRRLVPRGEYNLDYPKEIEHDAYFHPCVTKEADVLWIPRDEAGVSRQEVEYTSRVTPITDREARLNDKGGIEWDRDDARGAPVFKRRPYY